jgi:hypothetical protein
MGSCSMYVPAKVVLLVLLSACTVGEVPLNEGGSTDAGPDPNETSFNTTVKPLLMTCTACHAATPPKLGSYATLEAKYKMKPGNTNVFVTKADTTNGVHQGLPYFNADQKMTVARWIDELK